MTVPADPPGAVPDRSEGRPASSFRRPRTAPLTLTDAVGAFDRRVDAWFEPLRANQACNTAARVISGLGDHGLLWAVSTAWRARQPGPRRARSIKALAVAGVESSVVNAVLKGIVGRPRPEPDDLRLGSNVVPLRLPTSTSFPSGHTLAAFCAATVLAEPDDLVGTTLLVAGAGLIGLSRIHVGAHHASDVLGGAAIGTALGLLGRRLV